MLPFAARRALSAPPLATRLTSCLAASGSRPVASAAFQQQQQQQQKQQRFSSSKPSRSDSESNNGISAGQSVSASASSRAGSKAGTKASSGKGKRKNKEAFDSGAVLSKLPSVPETHHMSQEALSLSSFFSLHRPISITQTMPRMVTDEHFATIFAPRNKAKKMADTMSTLSSTIDQLEGPMASITIGADHGEQDGGGGMHRVDLKNPDGTESSVYLQVDAMAGDFLPFRPPPLPQPENGAGANVVASEAQTAEDVSHHRMYKAMFTIEESTEPDGQIRIVAHSPRIIQDEQPRSFIERLALRQLRFDEARSRRDLYAISVKRQRKLRMKKKKYKKLMKKTRNLRRKLDRT